MLYLFILIFVLGIVWWFYAYNTLVALKHGVDSAWSDVKTLLKRRYDLIPNLVATVKGYAAHEASTLENVVSARTQASHAADVGSVAVQAGLEHTLATQLRSVFALAEQYPDLKADTHFLELQKQLLELENSIQGMRMAYNDAVMKYNIYRESFPSVYVASRYGFVSREYFDLPEIENGAVEKVPSVSF